MLKEVINNMPKKEKEKYILENKKISNITNSNNIEILKLNLQSLNNKLEEEDENRLIQNFI